MANYNCNICQKPFNDIKQCIRHMSAHSNINTYKHQCIIRGCNREYGSKNSLQKHVNNHHSQHQNFDTSSSSFQSSLSGNLISNFVPIPSTTNNINEYDYMFSNPPNFRKNLLKYILKQYCDQNLSRKKCAELLNHMYSFYNTCFMVLFSNEENLEIQSMMKNLVNKNNGLISEYNLFRQLQKDNLYVKSITYTIDKIQNPIIGLDNSVKLKTTIISIQTIPLREIFYHFFNKTDFLQHVVDYMTVLESSASDEIQNVIQADLWKSHKSEIKPDSNTLLLPLKVFFDDFEPGNALGSHAGAYKICGVYTKIICMPPYMSSKLCFTFLAALFFSDDRKIYGNSRMLQKIITELNYIATEGIVVDFRQYKIVKIITTVISGDNLGLNSVLGFTESFRANHYCRFCKLPHVSSYGSMCVEDESSLRSKDNYAADLLLDDFKSTGIKEECVLNDIKHFHISRNFYADVMHDLYEGIHHYNFNIILENLINVEKYISLEQLNRRIQSFNYGIKPLNKPPIITAQCIKNGKFKMYASEMKTFSIFYGLIVGDLIPENNKSWKLYILLQDIMQIVFSHSVTHSDIAYLRNLISEHHEIYLNLVGDNGKLKPKYHILLHYPLIMRYIGSLRGISTFRDEAQHQFFKNTARTSKNRKNLLLTMSIKKQLQFSHVLLNFNDLIPKIEYGVLNNVTSVKKAELCEKYNFQCSNEIKTLNFLKYDNYEIKSGTVFLDTDNNRNEFYLVEKILYYNAKVVACVRIYEYLYFDRHYYAEKLKPTSSFCVRRIKITEIKTGSLIKSNGHTFFVYN